MSELKRYEEYRHDNGLYEDGFGEWVKYEDVKELEDKIAELESEWVSCEDRMPEKEDDYLIYPIPKYSTGIEYFNKYMDKGGHKPNTFESESEYGEVHVHFCITHWMPLPSPPKAKG